MTKAGLVLGAMVAVMAGNNYNSQPEAENELGLTNWAEQDMTFGGTEQQPQNSLNHRQLFSVPEEDAGTFESDKEKSVDVSEGQTPKACGSTLSM